MGLGAIVVVGGKTGTLSKYAASATPAKPVNGALLAGPLAGVEIMGRSVTQRIVERFLRADVDYVSVLVQAEVSGHLPAFRDSFENVHLEVVNDLGAAILKKLKDYAEGGIRHSFLTSADAYTETDLLDMFYFHREARQTVTRAFDREGPLALWAADCAKAQYTDLDSLLEKTGRIGVSYFIREYVNRMANPRDLRRFAADALRGRCAATPSGREVRPGVWIDEGAEIHRRARIVAPAYIGCGSRIREAALITRLSAIERNCSVDCGTVIEDSSLLANTHIGIWLDVCHAVVSGNKLLNLERNVMVEISDSTMVRSNDPSRAVAVARERVDEQVSVVDLPAKHPRPEGWLLGANLIEE